MSKKKSLQYKSIMRNRKVLIVLFVFLLLSIYIEFTKVFFTTLFIIANALLLTVDRYIDMPIDVEFSTFASVLSSIAFGVKWGIFLALSTKLVAIFYVGKIRVDHFFMLIEYSMAAVLASIFWNMGIRNIIAIGLIITLIGNIFIASLSKYVLSMYEGAIIMYFTTNFLFNLVMFMGFSQLFLGLMT